MKKQKHSIGANLVDYIQGLQNSRLQSDFRHADARHWAVNDMRVNEALSS